MASELDDLHVRLADDVARSLRDILCSHPALDALRGRLQEQDDMVARLRAELVATESHLSAVQAELSAVQAERDTIRREADVICQELVATRSELDVEREDMAAIRAELQQQAQINLNLQAELTSSHGDLDTLRSHLHAERQRTEDARADILRMTEEFETTLEDMRRDQATVASEQALAYSSLPLDALLTVFNALRRCSTLPDVLTALVNGIAREFTRVALFDVRGSHVEGAQQIGFEFEKDISKVVIPLAPESFLGRAVSSGRLETCFPTLNSDGSIPFGGSPACALAIPIVIQGATVAVIYADDSDTQEFASASAQMRAKFAEILQQHAMLVLLRIGLQQKTVTELREFVGLLVDELEYSHTANLEAGKNAIERQQDLRNNLDRSRRIYAQRAPRDGQAASGLLEDHLWAVMEGRGDSAFARDLAIVLGSIGSAPRAASVLNMRR